MALKGLLRACGEGLEEAGAGVVDDQVEAGMGLLQLPKRGIKAAGIEQVEGERSEARVAGQTCRVAARADNVQTFPEKHISKSAPQPRTGAGDKGCVKTLAKGRHAQKERFNAVSGGGKGIIAASVRKPEPR